MMEIAREIQEIAENAEKSINYPIGDKLSAFMRHQEQHEDSVNFILTGVLIHAATKVFGRKVDYLEQEILGIAKNFEQIEVKNDQEKVAKEVKKSRTKKYNIKDAININKTSFEEKEIVVSTRTDINKTLATPSRITRLQKMRDFFASNKTKSGKLPIPKSMLLLNDCPVSNFGSSLIYDYDDCKDIIGSRKDFTSFSHFIDCNSGELQSELNFNNKSVSKSEDFVTSDFSRAKSYDPHVAENLSSLPTPPPSPTFNEAGGKVTPIEANGNIDEGIEMDEGDRSSLLLSPTHPFSESPPLSPSKIIPMEISENITEFPPPQPPTSLAASIMKSIEQTREHLKDKVCDFELPERIKNDVNDTRLKNIFMVPLQRLKHKCLFELPGEEFRELKRRKLDQWKSTAPPEVINARLFKVPEITLNSKKSIDDTEEPFLGFTKEQQEESPMTIHISRLNETIPVNCKDLNDSGFESFCKELNNESTVVTSDDDGHESGVDAPHDLSSSSENEARRDSLLSNCEAKVENLSGVDSCYNSMASGISGESSKLSGPTFLDEYGTVNDETNLHENTANEEDSLESEERIQQMRQSAMNIAKWKEHLKPILAESEKRSKIDMHEYGLKVIHKIGIINETKSFDEIKDEGQIPAYFLTMLQLINNRNIEVKFANKSIKRPTALSDIKMTLKSKVVHKEKFDEMGEQFNQAEENKKVINTLKRKAVQTSTPAKRFIPSVNFMTPNTSAANLSQSMSEDYSQNSQQIYRILSQASSGYFSQNSFSDF